MAQWMGQYSGKTHGSRVRDLEDQLQHAVDVLRDVRTEAKRAQQQKKLTRMAERLLSARIRARKANALTNPDAVDNRLAAMIDGGVEAILSEFKIASDDDDAHKTSKRA